MVMFLALYPMESISLNSFVLLVRASSYVAVFNTRIDLISKFQMGLKFILHQGLLEPEFCGDLVF